jgi:hypothetical protein
VELRTRAWSRYALISPFSHPSASEVLTSNNSTFFHNFNGLEKLPKLATSFDIEQPYPGEI